jgi:hypothetical protein
MIRKSQLQTRSVLLITPVCVVIDFSLLWPLDDAKPQLNPFCGSCCGCPAMRWQHKVTWM